MVRKRKRASGIFTADGLKGLGVTATLIGTLWQGWQAGRKADRADERAGAVAAYAVNVDEQRDSLARRLRALEDRVRRLELVRRASRTAVYGPEPAPEWYHAKPVRGWLSRLLGHSDRR